MTKQHFTICIDVGQHSVCNKVSKEDINWLADFRYTLSWWPCFCWGHGSLIRQFFPVHLKKCDFTSIAAQRPIAIHIPTEFVQYLALPPGMMCWQTDIPPLHVRNINTSLPSKQMLSLPTVSVPDIWTDTVRKCECTLLDDMDDLYNLPDYSTLSMIRVTIPEEWIEQDNPNRLAICWENWGNDMVSPFVVIESLWWTP